MKINKARNYCKQLNEELAWLQKYLDLFRKGSAEHHGLSDAFMWHGVLLNNASYLWFKAHVKHSIRLIQHQVAELKKTEVLAKLRHCKKNCIPFPNTDGWIKFNPQFHPSLPCFCPCLTCNSLVQSCPSPSCPPVFLVWRPEDGILSPDLLSAGLCLLLHTQHTDALWTGTKTTRSTIKK